MSGHDLFAWIVLLILVTSAIGVFGYREREVRSRQ
ncbi:hypothetical protein HMPREF9695_01345 [Afipia broomeae ATCC 49717]|uniref:Uncharacterized protein n=1 Tax=Afipia broomeae ATCC 49717 TaxID=883078 RepID=K8PV82_9BRAD|nr:hypothetical protein HMPREF9695_01345 [Afipia broomeae ATCC 49717]